MSSHISTHFDEYSYFKMNLLLLLFVFIIITKRGETQVKSRAYASMWVHDSTAVP